MDNNAEVTAEPFNLPRIFNVFREGTSLADRFIFLNLILFSLAVAIGLFIRFLLIPSREVELYYSLERLQECVSFIWIGAAVFLAFAGLGFIWKELDRKIDTLLFIAVVFHVAIIAYGFRYTGSHVVINAFFLLMYTLGVLTISRARFGVFVIPLVLVFYAGIMILEQAGVLPLISSINDSTLYSEILGNPTICFIFAFIFMLPYIACLIVVIFYMNSILHKSEQIERLGAKLSQYLPRQLVRLLARGESEVTHLYDRKTVTVFLSDIKDFTGISDTVQPEEVSYILNLYLNRMCRIADQYGGVVDKFIGDAILVYFEEEGEDYKGCALQTVRMALSMQEEVEKLRDRIASEGYDINLQIRIGINTGKVIIGSFGAEDRMDYTIIGKEVDLAERIEQACKPGAVTVSHSTYLLTRDIVEYQSLGHVHPEGSEQAVNIYEVMGERAGQ